MEDNIGHRPANVVGRFTLAAFLLWTLACGRAINTGVGSNVPVVPPCSDQAIAPNDRRARSVRPPLPIDIPVPPVPPNVRGATAVIKLHIDSIGRVDRKSIDVGGISNQDYRDDFRMQVSTWRFSPAQDVAAKCALSINFTINLKL